MNVLPEAVVLFGAGGFIGRNILDTIGEKISKVIGVTASGRLLPRCAQVVRGDRLADIPDLPTDTIVINVAAARYNATNFRDEQSAILDANTRISTAVYRFCVERGIREVRLASSAAIYPAAWDLLDDEAVLDFNLSPHTGEAGYAWSKRFAEICADVHRSMYGIHTLTFRLTNPYGPYDSTDFDTAHVVAAFVMRALMSGNTFEIRGNPRAERDFVFSGDVAATFVASLHRRGEHAAYNIAAGESVNILALAESVIRASGINKKIVVTESNSSGVAIRKAASRKLHSVFALPDFKNLDAGLRKTVRWYRDALAH